MSYHLLLVCFLGSTASALKLNAATALKLTTPVSDSLELWNRTAFTLFGPYWAHQSPTQRTVLLRQLLSSGQVSDDTARKFTLLQSEKLRRAQRMKETGVEVIPGCPQGKPCTAKSYYEAVLLESGGGDLKDDCAEVVASDCLVQSLYTCMTIHFDPEKHMSAMDIKLITTWHDGVFSGYEKFAHIGYQMNAHAHSLLQTGSGDHEGCPAKASAWCVAHGYHKANLEALKAMQTAVAPPALDQYCYLIVAPKNITITP